MYRSSKNTHETILRYAEVLRSRGYVVEVHRAYGDIRIGEQYETAYCIRSESPFPDARQYVECPECNGDGRCTHEGEADELAASCAQSCIHCFGDGEVPAS